MLKDEYYIERIDYQTAMEIVKKYHYLHRVAPCSVAFGLFEKKTNLIVGCITYGVSSSSTLLKGICGEEEMHNVYELTRLWIKDGTPKNSESFLIGNTIKKLDKEIIVSFSEKDKGHTGIVYQASNFLYCGLSARFTDPVVEGLENQHHATFAHGMSNQQIKDKWGGASQVCRKTKKIPICIFQRKRQAQERTYAETPLQSTAAPKQHWCGKFS